MTDRSPCKYVETREWHNCSACTMPIPPGSHVLYSDMGTRFCRACDLDHINSLPDMERTNRLLNERDKAILEEKGGKRP